MKDIHTLQRVHAANDLLALAVVDHMMARATSMDRDKPHSLRELASPDVWDLLSQHTRERIESLYLCWSMSGLTSAEPDDHQGRWFPFGRGHES